MQDRSHDLSVRLERLERSNRRQRAALAGCAALALALGLAAFRGPADLEREIRTERLVLVGADGAELGSLGSDSDGYPMLLLRKDKAHAIVTLQQPGFAVRGPDGIKGAWIGIDPKGLVGVSLNGGSLQGGLRASVKPDGGAGFYALGDDGRERASLERLPDGRAVVSARNASGVPSASLGAGADGTPALLLLDAEGRRRAGMLVGRDGTPLLSFDDARGAARLEVSQRFDGHTRLRAIGEDGETRFEAP